MTRFAHNADVRVEDLIPEAYAAFAEPIYARFENPELVTKESDVAEAVWEAATDESDRLRFPAGALRWLLAGGGLKRSA